jgi:4-hydroxythreonine-4-phosphate dehydrogenase
MDTSQQNIVLAVTLGDVRGVGPEVTAKAFSVHEFGQNTTPLVIGPRGAYGRALELVEGACSGWRTVHPASLSDDLSEFDTLEVAIPAASMEALKQGSIAAPEVGIGPSEAVSEKSAGWHAGRAIELAVRLAMKGLAKAVVTAPLDKRALNLGGYPHPGHTEMLKELAGARAVAMMLIGGALRVTIATTHIPFHRVLSELSAELLLEKIRLTNEALTRLFSIRKPVIGLCALNPHAGEGGMVGDDEARVLEPTITLAAEEGMVVRGPMPSDTIFNACMAGELDAVVALYHDQGMIPIKVHAFGKGVNLTLGLPFVRTSPDHGTARDIAWQGKADAGSMIEALTLAEKLSTLTQL